MFLRMVGEYGLRTREQEYNDFDIAYRCFEDASYKKAAGGLEEISCQVMVKEI